MILNRLLKSAICGVFLTSTVVSCFTGIESTPKITASNVRESGVRITDEQKFADLIMPEPPGSWKRGKSWLVDNNRVALTFTSASDNSDSIAGHTLFYEDIRVAPTLTGAETVEVVLRAYDGRTFYHRTNVDTAEWSRRASYDIPFTVEMSAVALADSLMNGQSLFIGNPRWLDSDGADIMGQRHVPVTIVGVRPGNHIYPLIVGFSQNSRPDEPVRFIPMTYGKETSSNRNFDKIFSFTDPRKLYPKISDATWRKIINSQIAEGMSRDECRLALGTPAGIERGMSLGTQVERWSYENGVYLLFEDGVLTKFRL